MKTICVYLGDHKKKKEAERKEKQRDCPNSTYKHLVTTMVPLFQPKLLFALALGKHER